MKEFLQLAMTIDWSSLFIGAGTVATALGLGLGTPLIIAGKTLREVRKVIDKTPFDNTTFQVAADQLELRHAAKELKKLPPNWQKGKS